MAELWIGNIDAHIADDEINELLVKYGFPPFDAVQHVASDGPRPAVVLTFEDTDPELLRRLQPRVHNLFWKGRRINVQVMKDRSE